MSMEGLTSLDIGGAEGVGDGGIAALTAQCRRLQSLNISGAHRVTDVAIRKWHGQRWDNKGTTGRDAHVRQTNVNVMTCLARDTGSALPPPCNTADGMGNPCSTPRHFFPSKQKFVANATPS